MTCEIHWYPRKREARHLQKTDNESKQGKEGSMDSNVALKRKADPSDDEDLSGMNPGTLPKRLKLDSGNHENFLSLHSQTAEADFQPCREP
ncbi:hypothetical protein U1Q18_024567 [Sarracenia purpurea var. burkii]